MVFHFSVAGSVFRGTSEMGRGTAHTFRREIFLVCPCFVVVGGRPWKRHVECVRRRRPVTIITMLLRRHFPRGISRIGIGQTIYLHAASSTSFPLVLSLRRRHDYAQVNHSKSITSFPYIIHGINTNHCSTQLLVRYGDVKRWHNNFSSSRLDDDDDARVLNQVRKTIVIKTFFCIIQSYFFTSIILFLTLYRKLYLLQSRGILQKLKNL